MPAAESEASRHAITGLLAKDNIKLTEGTGVTSLQSTIER
jgi:hypothetical protein